MNKLESISFDTSIDMAKWIIKNIPNPLIQEQLMNQGLRNKQLNDQYEIVAQKSYGIPLLAQIKLFV